MPQIEDQSGGEMSGIMVHEVLPSLQPLQVIDKFDHHGSYHFFFIRDLLGNGRKYFRLSKVNLMCNPIQKIST